MSDLSLRTKQQLIDEIKALRQRVAELEKIGQNAASQSAVPDERTYSERFFSEQDENLRMFLDFLPVGVSLISQDGNIIWHNAALEKILDISGEALREGSYKSRKYIRSDGTPLPPEEYPSRRAITEKRALDDIEIGVIKENGETIWINVSAAPLPLFYEGVVTVTTDITARKRAENAQRISDARFRLLVDNSPAGLYMADNTFHFVYANQRLADMLGCTVEEVLASDFRTFIAEEFLDQMVDAYVRRRRGEDVPDHFELVAVRKDGEKRWLEVYVASVVFPDGQARTWGQALDITDRKRTEEALRESEERYRIVSEMISDYAYCNRVEPNGVAVTEWETESIAKVTSYSSRDMDNFQAQRDFTLYHPDDQVRAIADKISLLQGHEINADYRIVSKKGEIRWLRLYRRPVWDDKQKRVIRYYGVAQDITERKRAEEALGERESLLSAIINSQIDFICRYTPDTILTFVNDAYCRLVQRSREDLLGQSFLNLVPEEEHAGIMARLDEAIYTREPGVREFYTILPDGAVQWVQWVDQAIIDDDGEILIQAVGRDITAQKKAEEELLQLNHQLEQRVVERTAELASANERLLALSRVKDEFVSNVSHELRTPITSLKLRQYLLRKAPERLDQHVDVIERETNRLQHTIEDLLQLSRLDQRQTDLALAPVNINSVVKRYVSDRVMLAEAKGLALSFAEEQHLPDVLADEGLLEQSLGILLTNAINYTPTGGSITVSTLTQTREAQHWVGFSVADTGPGILPEDQSRLFERFFRGKTGRASAAPGTGLGLSIAKEIVSRHRGRIEVESKGIPGEGTTFTVWLRERQ